MKSIRRLRFFKQKTELSGKEWFLITILFVVADLLASLLFYNSLKVVVIFIPCYFLFAKAAAYWLFDIRRRKLKQEFRTWMMLLYSMISAGESLENAIEDSMNELIHMGTDTLMIAELRRMVSRMNMNYPVVRCLDDFAKRVKDEDITDFCEIMKLAREKGGSMRRIVRSSIERINEKVEMECEIETIIAGKKNEFLIMACIPIGMILYMRLGSPELMKVLYQQLGGRLIMTVSLIVYIFAIYIGVKMTQITS